MPRSHLPRRELHEQKMAAAHQGKHQWQATREAEASVRDPAAQEPEWSFTARDSSFEAKPRR